MPGDGHEVTTPCHGVTQDSQVTVVHIGPVKLNHSTQLLQERIPGCLNAQHINRLDDVVAGGPGVVDARHAHDLQ